MGKRAPLIRITETSPKAWQWELLSGNGQTLVMKGGYNTKGAANRAALKIQETFAEATVTAA